MLLNFLKIIKIYISYFIYFYINKYFLRNLFHKNGYIASII